LPLRVFVREPSPKTHEEYIFDTRGKKKPSISLNCVTENDINTGYKLAAEVVIVIFVVMLNELEVVLMIILDVCYQRSNTKMRIIMLDMGSYCTQKKDMGPCKSQGKCKTLMYTPLSFSTVND